MERPARRRYVSLSEGQELERPARRRYVSLSEGQELLTPFECLPLAVSDVLFKYIGVNTRIRLMCVSRAMRAMVDRSAEIKPPHPCNNTLSIKFINTDISDENTQSDDLIAKCGVRLLFRVRASVTFAGQTASETFEVPLINYDGRTRIQETPFLDRCIARIMRMHADRVTELHLEGRPPFKFGEASAFRISEGVKKDVRCSHDFLPVPVCLGMHLLTSLHTIRLKNISLCTPKYYMHRVLPTYRLLEHPVHLFYSHSLPYFKSLRRFITRQFTALHSLIIAPIEFAQPMYDLDDLIIDKWKIPVIDIPVDIMSIKSTSQLGSLRTIAAGCEELRLSINLDVFRNPKVSTQDKVLDKVDIFFQKLNGVQKVSQIYVYNIPLRNSHDVAEFHQILQNVLCDRMIVGSIRRTRADKTAWVYGSQLMNTDMTTWIGWNRKMMTERYEKKKWDKKTRDSLTKLWRRKWRKVMKVWVEAHWEKLEKNWVDKVREIASKVRRKEAWLPVQRVKRSRALVKALAKILGADVEPFHRNVY